MTEPIIVHSTPSKTFHDLPINPDILDVLDKNGFHVPTQIQAEAIPPALEGKDVHAHVFGMASFRLPRQRCPNCRSLYEYSERPNSLRLDAPTERFCSECGDLVAAWPGDEIRVYIFIANARGADELEKS